ncbi:MAG TPA: hypothetical protein VFS43_28520 [Polyangiaceae bacterium]|nr:hypothetical protein [Polyangiaceae bacterium]
MRRRLWHRALPWVSTGVLAGCGGEPPPRPAPPPPPPVAAPAEPQPDLSPVPEPPTLVATARWKNLASTLGAFDKMTNLPFRLQQEIERALGGAEATKAVKLDGNAELAAMLEPAGASPTPELYVAFSLPLRSSDEARAAAERQGVSLRPLRPGVWRAGRRRFGGGGAMTCDIAASKGEAPARLVCARRERELDALGPFLARTLPGQAVGPGDVSVRVRLQPVRETYGRFLETTGRALGPAAALALAGRMGISDPLVGETVGDLAGEASDVLQDVDLVSFDATLEPGGSFAKAVGSVRFRGKRAWTTRALTAKNDQAGPPPPIFWQAPKDSDAVGYDRGSDRELARPPLKRLGALASALTRPILPEPDRRAFERVFVNLPVYGTNSVTASGHLDPPAPSKPAPGTPAERVRAARDAFAQSLGWTVYGVDGPHVALKDWLRDVATAASGRGVQQLFDKSDELKRVRPTFKSVPPPAGLPPRTAAFEFSATLDSALLDRAAGPGAPDAPAKKPPAAAKGKLSAFVVVMPDGVDRTWVGVAADPAVLKKRLLSVRANAPAENKLSAREGLDALREEKHLSASFSSLAGLTSSLRGGGLLASLTGDKSPFGELDAALSALPHKGQTPIFFVGDGTAGDAPSNSFELRVRRETIEDAVALAFALALPRGQAPGPVAPAAPPRP